MLFFCSLFEYLVLVFFILTHNISTKCNFIVQRKYLDTIEPDRVLLADAMI